jgi:hypothetical protein
MRGPSKIYVALTRAAGDKRTSEAAARAAVGKAGSQEFGKASPLAAHDRQAALQAEGATPSLHQLGEQGSTTSGGFLSLLSGEQLLIPKEEGVGSEETTPPQARLFGRALLPLSRGPCAVVEGLITRSLITPLRYFITGLSQVIKYLRGLTHNHYP